MPVHIVTDSTADLPADLVQQYGISVIPLLIYFGEQEFRDGVDLDANSFYERLQQSETMPRTSQPAVETFRELYDRLLVNNDDYVFSIHVSGKLSGTMNSAQTARGMLGDKSSRVTIFDGESVSAGNGVIAVQAARAAATGSSLEEVESIAEDVRARSKLFALVDRLDYLQKGGRIGKAASLVGGLLKVNPLLSVENGEVVPYARVRTHTKAVERLRQIAVEQDAESYFVGYGTNETEAEAFAAALREGRPGADVRLFQIGPTIGVYTGPGVLGFVFVSARR